MKRAGLAAAAALAIVVGSASTPVIAAPCDVFTDVDDTDIFCKEVQWLKNRSITLGCTSPTVAYCPKANVTRDAMALFLFRLGRVITPKFVSFQGATGPTTLMPNDFIPLCVASPVADVSYPQTVRARGSIAIPASGPALDMFLVLSVTPATVPPTPPAPYINLNSTLLRINNPTGQQNLTWLSNTMAIPPGNSLTFAIGVSNPAGSGGNLLLSAGSCAIEADVINANPSSPPFDQ